MKRVDSDFFSDEDEPLGLMDRTAKSSLSDVSSALRGARWGTALYYFAYGSNMDEGQMALRYSNAKLVERANFADHSFLINERGVASVTAAPNRVLHGL